MPGVGSGLRATRELNKSAVDRTGRRLARRSLRCCPWNRRIKHAWPRRSRRWQRHRSAPTRTGSRRRLPPLNTASRTSSHAETRRSETLLLYSCATIGPAATAEATRSHFRSSVAPLLHPNRSSTPQTGRLAEFIPRICSCRPRWITYIHERVAARGMNAPTSSPHAGHVTVARPTSPSRNLVGACSMRPMSVAIGTDSPGSIKR
jgi:hypothetical protein